MHPMSTSFLPIMVKPMLGPPPPGLDRFAARIAAPLMVPTTPGDVVNSGGRDMTTWDASWLTAEAVGMPPIEAWADVTSAH